MIFSIFRVYDYKGGELSNRINLSRVDFLNELWELFEHLDFGGIKNKRDRRIKKVLDEDVSDDIAEIESIINAHLNNKDLNYGTGFYSAYAGPDGFCGKMYLVNGDRMTEVKVEDFVDELAKHISDNM